MKKTKLWIFTIIISLLIVLLFTVDLTQLINHECFSVLKANIAWIKTIWNEYSFLIVTIAVLLLLIWFNTVFSISLNNATILGIEFSLKDTDRAVKNNMRNYLSTKRSLFCIDKSYDNFCEVFDSYYSIYEFLRIQIAEYDNSNNSNSAVYQELIAMVRELNQFLTQYQSDFREWLKWKREKNEKYVEFSNIQKEYPRYTEMIDDFRRINTSMSIHAKHFNIHIIDWVNKQNNEVIPK